MTSAGPNVPLFIMVRLHRQQRDSKSIFCIQRFCRKDRKGQFDLFIVAIYFHTKNSAEHFFQVSFNSRSICSLLKFLCVLESSVLAKTERCDHFHWTRLFTFNGVKRPTSALRKSRYFCIFYPQCVELGGFCNNRFRRKIFTTYQCF